jgi:hypothetical protein
MRKLQEKIYKILLAQTKIKQSRLLSIYYRFWCKKFWNLMRQIKETQKEKSLHKNTSI